MLAPSKHTDAIPVGWVQTTLQSVTAPRGLKVKPAAMPGVPFLGLEHIEAHTMKLLGMGQTHDVKSAGSYFAQGDVLYGRLRPYLNKVHMPGFTGLASGEFIVFPSQNFLDNAYLKYFLNQVGFASFATRLNAGDRPRVDFSQLSDHPFPLPPLAEQHRIVAEIEKQFTRLDASVAALKRIQANLKRYRASVLRAACEGELVPTEAELARAEGRDYEPADRLLERILADRRARWEAQEKRRGRYKEPSYPDTSALSELPMGWVWATLSQISDLKGGATKGRRFRAGESLTEVLYLRVANVQRGYLDLSELKTIEVTQEVADQLALVPGDILFTEGGDRDKLGRGWIWKGELDKCIHQNHIFRSRLLLTEMHPEFVSWWGNSFGQTFFEHSGKQTTNLASINLSVLSSFPVPLPPLAEQRRIVAEVERRLSVIQQAEATVEANLPRAERLRQSILKQAFSGKLVSQDPGDEPASALLERIRVEREASHADAKNSRPTRPRRGKSLSARQLVLREGNP